VSRRGFTVRAAADDDSVEIALKVEGMMCDGCASSVTEALTGASPDVSSVDVNLETKMVTGGGQGGERGGGTDADARARGRGQGRRLRR
jgi:copper chaperone CopZ